MEYYNIVLAAGKDGNPKGLFNPNIGAFTLVSGKPSIYWTLNNVHDLSNTVVSIAVNNKKLQDYIKRRFPKVQIVCVEDNCSIIESLSSCMELVPDGSFLRLLLADTYLKYNEKKFHFDCFFTSKNILESRRWCLVDVDKHNKIKNFYDKIEIDNLSNKSALVGCYHFSDVKKLNESITKSIASDKTQLSDVLKLYSDDIPIKSVPFDDWIDFGHIKGLADARIHFLSNRTRSFNKIEYIPQKSILIKTSTNKKKLHQEYIWYNEIPDDIKLFIPRVYKYIEKDNYSKLTMEMYGYSPLSDAWVYGDAGIEEWTKLIDNLFLIQALLKKHHAKRNFYDFKKIYIDKTKERVFELRKTLKNEILTCSYLSINGKKYRNYPLLETKIYELIDRVLISTKTASVIHGDFCFSNILFDPNYYIFKLIDPRGNFGEDGIYGDPRYDIAKLRHSIIGAYDVIIAGLFEIKIENTNEYIFNILPLNENSRLAEYFDNLLKEYGYNLLEIKLIEALLFLTMVPLHSDSKERQLAFYLTAIKKLNEIL